MAAKRPELSFALIDCEYSYFANSTTTRTSWQSSPFQKNLNIASSFLLSSTTWRYRKNIILANCQEERPIDSADYNPKRQPSVKATTTRQLQQAMVPGHRLVKVEIDRDIFKCKIGCDDVNWLHHSIRQTMTLPFTLASGSHWIFECSAGSLRFWFLICYLNFPPNPYAYRPNHDSLKRQ